MTVGRLSAEMSSAELSDWIAYYELEAEDRSKREVAARAARAHDKAKALPKRGRLS